MVFSKPIPIEFTFNLNLIAPKALRKKELLFKNTNYQWNL